MVKRMGGSKRKSRGRLKKSIRRKGKISLSKYFQTFNEHDKVRLNAEPSCPNGMYFRRFHNKFGIIKGKRGECYEIIIKDGNKNKMIIVHPVHLRRA